MGWWWGGGGWGMGEGRPRANGKGTRTPAYQSTRAQGERHQAVSQEAPRRNRGTGGHHDGERGPTKSPTGRAGRRKHSGGAPGHTKAVGDSHCRRRRRRRLQQPHLGYIQPSRAEQDRRLHHNARCNRKHFGASSSLPGRSASLSGNCSRAGARGRCSATTPEGVSPHGGSSEGAGTWPPWDRIPDAVKGWSQEPSAASS